METKTANSSHEARVAQLPTKVRERLKGCPTEGQGIHPWLFNTARSLHKHFSEEEIVDILCANLSCQRPEREVRDAVVNAGKYARGEVGSPSQTSSPMVDYTMVHNIVVNSPIRLKGLSAISPTDLSTKVNLPRFDGHGNSKKERGPDGSKKERAPGVYGAIQKPGSGDGDPQR